MEYFEIMMGALFHEEEKTLFPEIFAFESAGEQLTVSARRYKYLSRFIATSIELQSLLK